MTEAELQDQARAVAKWLEKINAAKKSDREHKFINIRPITTTIQHREFAGAEYTVVHAVGMTMARKKLATVKKRNYDATMRRRAKKAIQHVNAAIAELQPVLLHYVGEFGVLGTARWDRFCFLDKNLKLCRATLESVVEHSNSK